MTGDEATPEVPIQAHVARAAMLVIAIPDPVNVCKMVEIAGTLNPSNSVVLHSHKEEETELLRKETEGIFFLGEHELASGMTRHIVNRLRGHADKSSST